MTQIEELPANPNEQPHQEIERLRQRLSELESSLDESRKTISTLQQSEQLYRTILENIPPVTYVIGVGNEPLNSLIYSSPQTKKVVGYTSEEFLKDPLLWVKMIYPEDQDRVMAESEHADLTGGPMDAEYRVISSDNVIAWFHDESVLVKDAHGQPLNRVGILTDVTKRKQAEVALRKLEDIYRQAIMSAGAVPYVLDHATHTLTFIGDGVLAMTGYSAAEMTSTPRLWNTVVLQSIPTGNLAHLTYEEADRITEEDRSIPWECDFLIRTRDGQLRWIADTSVKSFDEKSEHVLSIGIKQDITDRKQAEAALLKSASRLELLHNIDRALLSAQSPAEIARDALTRIRQLIPSQRTSITLFDFEKNEASFLVASFDEAFDPAGQSVDTLQVYGQYIIDELLQDKACRVDDVLTDPRCSELDKALAKDGFRSWLFLPLLSQGQLIGALNFGRTSGNPFTVEEEGIAHEVANQLAIVLKQNQLNESLQTELAERMRAEAEREKLIAELEQRNAELERLAYTLSHELKSPLITIRGFLGYLRDDAISGNINRLDQDIQRITGGTEKMLRLINELIELMSMGRIIHEFKEMPLRALVDEAVELVSERLTSEKITVLIADNLSPIHGDHKLLVDVFQNLLENAVKFMGEQPEPQIEIGQRYKEADVLTFYVRDNGIGIDPRFADRIFGIFHKLDAKSEGTGIGLALIKRIIETHGGKIWVESDGLGKGSTFCFTIPDGRGQGS